MEGTGIGPALRNARVQRGKSIEEASRETRIRAEYLQALERERFEALLGDVYVRGCLRSYSAYLGIDPGQVLTVYNREFGQPQPASDPLSMNTEAPPGRGGSLREKLRHHPTWTLMAALAVLALIGFGAAGLLSRSRSAPAPAPLSTAPATLPVEGQVTLVIAAKDEVVQAVITVDGTATSRFVLRPGESRTFAGTQRIGVQLDRGGAADLTVNDYHLGSPGSATIPYTASFFPSLYFGQTQHQGPPGHARVSSPQESSSPAAP